MQELNRHTDWELVELARSGEQRAFNALVIRHQKKVATTIIGMLGKTPEAEDVGQETFLRFYNALHTFRGDASVSTYLTKIAINLCLNELNRRKKRSFLSLFSLAPNRNQNEEPFELPLPDTSQKPDNFDNKDLIQIALQQLDPKFRSVVVLRLIEGYSTNETAQLLNLPLGTVLSRLARAQDKLKELLQHLF